MNPGDPCAHERAQLAQHLNQANSETYRQSVDKVRVECAEIDAQIEQTRAESVAFDPEIEKARQVCAQMDPEIEKARAENAAMQPEIDRAIAENAAMQATIDKAVAANQSMAPGDAKNRHWNEVVQPLIDAKNRHWNEVVQPLIDAKNRHWNETGERLIAEKNRYWQENGARLIEEKNRHWAETGARLIDQKNQHWNQSVGQINQDLQTRNQAVSAQISAMDCSEVREQLQQARQPAPAEPPAPAGPAWQEDAPPAPAAPPPIPTPPPISNEELDAVPSGETAQPPATPAPTDAAPPDKPPDIPQGVLEILEGKTSAPAEMGTTVDAAIDQEVKELLEGRRYEGGYTREEVTQGIHAQRIAELMKELGKLDDPQKLLTEHDARVKTPEFQQLSKDEQISIEAGVWNRVHAQQRLDLAKAPGNTISQISRDGSETTTEVLHPDGTIYTRTEQSKGSNDRQVYENWVYADGTQVTRQKIESRQESSQKRANFSEYTMQVLSSEHTTCHVYATTTIETAHARGLPLPPAIGITRVDQQAMGEQIASLRKNHRHGPWEG